VAAFGQCCFATILSLAVSKPTPLDLIGHSNGPLPVKFEKLLSSSKFYRLALLGEKYVVSLHEF